MRFAEKPQSIPNFEVKFAKKPLDAESFNDRITAKTKAGDLFISSLERQIAFKRYYLGTDKDMEDATYIEKLFKESIDKKEIGRYKKLIQLLIKHEKAKNFIR